jgi:hypothetical protein
MNIILFEYFIDLYKNYYGIPSDYGIINGCGTGCGYGLFSGHGFGNGINLYGFRNGNGYGRGNVSHTI